MWPEQTPELVWVISLLFISNVSYTCYTCYPMSKNAMWKYCLVYQTLWCNTYDDHHTPDSLCIFVKKIYVYVYVCVLYMYMMFLIYLPCANSSVNTTDEQFLLLSLEIHLKHAILIIKWILNEHSVCRRPLAPV